MYITCDSQVSCWLPIVVEPTEAQSPFKATQSDLSSVVEPEARNNMNLATSLEPERAENENEICFINYGKEYQGLLTYT